jgi:hypothetical protein
MRTLLAAALFASAALLTEAAWAAEGPPAPPPAAPAPAPAAAVVAAPGCGCCPAPDPCRGIRLEIQGHLSLLTPDPEGLVAVDEGPDPVRWDPIEYEAEFGGRVAVTFPWSSWDVTVAGTWWGQWEDDATDFGTLTSTPFPGGPPGTSGPFDVELHEEATLWDVNLTFTRAWVCTPCFTSRWGVGARWLHFDEQAEFRFPGIGAAPVASQIGSDVDNDLIAAELVAEGVWKLARCWDFVARGSVFAGWMHREGEVATANVPGGVASPTGEDDGFGYGGELEIALRWRPSGCWWVSVGYGLLVLGPVTRAHESMDFASVGAATPEIGPVFQDDTLLVHRVFLGVGFDF